MVTLEAATAAAAAAAAEDSPAAPFGTKTGAEGDIFDAFGAGEAAVGMLCSALRFEAGGVDERDVDIAVESVVDGAMNSE